MPSAAALKEFRQHRDQRNQEMLGRFDAHGIHLTAEELHAPGTLDTVITRPMWQEPFWQRVWGLIWTIFLRNICNTEAYTACPRNSSAPEAVMEAPLLDSHAFVALAHPFQYKLGDKGHGGAHRLSGRPGYERPGGISPPTTAWKARSFRKWRRATICSPQAVPDFHGSNKPDISIGQGGAVCGLLPAVRCDIKTPFDPCIFY